MKVSASIELVWQLAGKEAIAGQFKEIGPEHFWMALLKFSELPVEQTAKIAAGADAAKQLAAEVDAVRDELARRNMDSTRVRRELRAKMGKSDHPFDGGQIHRSPGSRELFDSAARIADDGGADTLTPKNLLQALLAFASPAMNKILGKAAQASPLAPVQTPLLSKHHEEFSESSEEWQTRETEKVALLQVLSLQKCRCVFLVSDRDRDVSPILVNLTRTLSEPSKCPTSLKGRVIFNLVSLKPTERRKTEVLQLWESLFEEAAGANKAILYVPPIESGHNRDAIRDWLGLLKEALRKGAFQCVGRVSQDAYRECIKTDAAWKRLSHAMRIQRETKLELPQEL